MSDDKLTHGTLSSIDVVHHGRGQTLKRLAGLLHAILELTSLRGCRDERTLEHLGAYLALLHVLLELCHALAGSPANLLERIEPGVNHLEQVLPHEMTGRCSLPIGE